MFFPEAAQKLSAPLLKPEPSLAIEGASIDTRTLKPGNLFVALRGEKEDGHRYLDAAFQKGASGALIETSFAQKSGSVFSPGWKNLMAVPDPAGAFLRLSAVYRQSFSLSAAVGVVGSVGKTSTKEFLAYLLSKKFKTLSTQGNLNNHLGLPLTLMGLTPAHQICVCELGTNRLGDVRQLAQVLKPDFGLLTRVAPEHLEGFGGMEQVYEGEAELFECLRSGSCAVIPEGDPELEKRLSRFPLKWVRVGEKESADYRVTEMSSKEGKVSFKVNGVSFAFPGAALFLARNAAMAVAMAEICGVRMSELPEVWDDFKLPDGRFQIQHLPCGAQAIFDGYNASPASFEAALETFEGMRADGRKFLVVSDMLELGAEERKYHETLGRQIGASKVDCVIGYGPRTQWSLEILKQQYPEISVEYVQNAEEAGKRLQELVRKGDCLLLKASRGMRIENALKGLSGSEKSLIH